MRRRPVEKRRPRQLPGEAPGVRTRLGGLVDSCPNTPLMGRVTPAGPIVRYTVNELPQPQLVFALGLMKCKPLPIKAESYSSVVPAR